MTRRQLTVPRPRVGCKLKWLQLPELVTWTTEGDWVWVHVHVTCRTRALQRWTATPTGRRRGHLVLTEWYTEVSGASLSELLTHQEQQGIWISGWYHLVLKCPINKTKQAWEPNSASKVPIRNIRHQVTSLKITGNPEFELGIVIWNYTVKRFESIAKDFRMHTS